MALSFTEYEESGISYSYDVKEVLLTEKTEFQEIQVFETSAFGRMMAIDGYVMLTERDEFVYHEMIAHIPTCFHPDPRHVVVIGGGDGGTVRELLKHKCIEKITLCEIDGAVVEASKKYFPQVACGFEDPRVDVIIGDGIAYMAERSNEIDIVLVDSTDPVGPGEGLFTKAFYRSVARAMREGGIMAAQSESPWASADFLKRIQSNICGGFAHKYPYTGPVPTYPFGLWSWTLASGHEIDLSAFDSGRLASVADSLQYLNADKISGSFALPRFFSEKID